MRVLHLYADTPRALVLQYEPALNSRKAPTRTLGAPHMFEQLPRIHRETNYRPCASKNCADTSEASNARVAGPT